MRAKTRRTTHLPSSSVADVENKNGKEKNDLQLIEVDVLYGSRNRLVYNPKLERFIRQKDHHDDDNEHVDKSRRRHVRWWWKRKVLPLLKAGFVPNDVTDAYYRFMKWRILQRYINAIVHVLGTQSLLLGLGLKHTATKVASKSLGLAAALHWVMKDALGKVVRLLWASKMGRKFDSDAKRWRFRSSLVYAIGNALEIVTYIHPNLFLLYATTANSCKQISMLTSSSTRTALYNSFRTTEENIGDITAKGEAQIAIVDLCGIVSGICLSPFCLGIKQNLVKIGATFVALQFLELICLYRMVHAVEFRVVNFERLIQMVQDFGQVMHDNNHDKTAVANFLPTPRQVAATEKIFLPPRHLSRRSICFGSLGRAKLSLDELNTLLEIFKGEKFLLVVGENVKRRRRRRRRSIQEDCHVVLHRDATNTDIVKATLALVYLRLYLRQQYCETTTNDLRSRDCHDLIRRAAQRANQDFTLLLQFLSQKGWAPPSRFMFGRVTMRAEWPLSSRSNDGKRKRSKTTTTEVHSTNENNNNSTMLHTSNKETGQTTTITTTTTPDSSPQ